MDSVNPDVLHAYSDFELGELAAAIRYEQQQRAIAAVDPDALVEDGFSRGFSRQGEPCRPWLMSGVLVCPGGLRETSRLSHRCAFVSVDGSWVWETDSLADVVRHVTGRAHEVRSVTLVPAYDGMELDFVKAKTRNGVHEVVQVLRFRVEGASLVEIPAKTSAASHGNHRR
jgi:hypothetical protein